MISEFFREYLSHRIKDMKFSHDNRTGVEVLVDTLRWPYHPGIVLRVLADHCAIRRPHNRPILGGFALVSWPLDIAIGYGPQTTPQHTYRWPHRIWHSAHEEWLSDLRAIPNSSHDRQRFWLSGMYVTSERKPHLTVDRSLEFTHAADEVLHMKAIGHSCSTTDP